MLDFLTIAWPGPGSVGVALLAFLIDAFIGIGPRLGRGKSSVIPVTALGVAGPAGGAVALAVALLAGMLISGTLGGHRWGWLVEGLLLSLLLRQRALRLELDLRADRLAESGDPRADSWPFLFAAGQSFARDVVGPLFWYLFLGLAGALAFSLIVGLRAHLSNRPERPWPVYCWAIALPGYLAAAAVVLGARTVPWGGGEPGPAAPWPGGPFLGAAERGKAAWKAMRGATGPRGDPAALAGAALAAAVTDDPVFDDELATERMRRGQRMLFLASAAVCDALLVGLLAVWLLPY